jgi:hypothetical protein
VALLESRVAAKWGRPARPRELRSHLRLGTPGGGGISHQPDLAYHLAMFDQGGILSHSFQGELRLSSLQPQARMGSAMASPGDVDGDGLADIAIGAPDAAPNVNPSVGRVYLFSAKDDHLLWTADGLVGGEGLGRALAGIGDVNGDGKGDLAAGAPGDGFAQPGTVRVLSGADGTQIYALTVGSPPELFGAAVAKLGADLDADGAPEIVVGAPGDFSTQGRVEVRSGRTGSLLWSVTASAFGSQLGYSVAALGDVNGDGVSDVIAGAPREFDPATGKTPGAIYAYSGRNGHLLFTLKGEVPLGTFNNEQFGTSVAGAGDLTGDGVPDFVVGAPGWTQTPGGANFGKVYLYKTAGLGATLIQSYTGTQHFQALGTSVAGIGDWDGDGHPDVAAGQPAGLSSPCCAMPPGKVFVFQWPFGPQLQTAPAVQGGAPISSPISSQAAPAIVVQPVPGQPVPILPRGTTKVFTTKDTSTTFGTGVAALGDTTGDGRPDFGAGEPFFDEGRAFVFSSAPSPAVTTARLVAEVPAIEAADTNGDGFSGGGLSPSSVIFHFDAGPTYANAAFAVFGIPKPPFDTNPIAQGLVAGGSPFLVNFSGTLDANGQTTAPVFGPIPKIYLCPGLAGAEWDFIAGAAIDTNGDGILDQFVLSNPATVRIIWELFPGC